MATSVKYRSQDTYEHIEREEEVLENNLSRLQKVKGYMASAAMTFRGEILAAHSAEGRVDLREVGSTFNDIFRSAHEASAKIGLNACLETVFNTPRGVIVMRCSGVEALLHFHILAIFSTEGNLALAKMELEKMVAPILAELS